MYILSEGKIESLSTSMILIDGDDQQGSVVSITQPTPRPGNLALYIYFNLNL